MILADKIILLRKKSGWSQEELAEKLSVTRQAISKWEGAQSVPELGKILQLSELFGVSTDYLLKDELEEEAPSVTPEATSARRVTMEEADRFLKAKEATSKPIAWAVLLCVLSPICLLLLGAATETYGISENLAGGLGLAVLLVLVGCAVPVFILCGMKTRDFEFLEQEDIEPEYGVRGMAKERREQYKSTYTKSCVIGTSLCIFGVIPLILTSIFTENAFHVVLALSFLLVCVGIACIFFVRTGIIWDSFNKLLEDGDYTREKKRNSRRWGWFAGAYWLLVTAVYLLWSFLTDDWNNKSWIVWPVAGVLFPALMLALWSVRKHSDK